MNFFDHWTPKPLDELQSAWNRVPHTEYSKIGSLKGRAVCVLKIFTHTASFVIKPSVYLVCGIALTVIGSPVALITKLKGGNKELRIDFLSLGVNLILTAVVAPVGQIFQIFKATMSLLHPACYFKKDKLHQYFVQLADIAKDVNCDPKLVKLIKNGSEIIHKKLYFSSSNLYYYALFERDLSIVCDKLSHSDLSHDQKFAILDMLVPLPDRPDETGINACSPGFGRILEQMCNCLDVPQNPEKIIPWIEGLYKVDILNLMAVKSDVVAKYWNTMDINEKPKVEKEWDRFASHFSNFLITNLGKQIGLPPKIIETASQDLTNLYHGFAGNDEKELLAIYHKLYSEKNWIDYLIKRINSQPDGGAGLKGFRNYIIEKLCENTSEKEIESSLKEVQNKFGLSVALADEPIYYVKYHYFLYPDAKPSDENSSDLNEKGIKAFLKITKT